VLPKIIPVTVIVTVIRYDKIDLSGTSNRKKSLIFREKLAISNKAINWFASNDISTNGAIKKTKLNK
jgi:hypothetical protein